MRRRVFPAMAVLACVVTACSSTAPDERSIEVAGELPPPTAVVLPGPTALPTTEPVIAAQRPDPTPIALSGGLGIVVPDPVPDPDGAAEATGSEDAEADGYNQAVGVQPTDPAGDASPAADGDATTEPGASADDASGSTGEDIELEQDGPEDPEVPVANGSEVYSLNCARCHSENGLGSFQASGLLNISTRLNAAQMVHELTHGHPVTFGFGDKLSATEINDVVAYVLATFG